MSFVWFVLVVVLWLSVGFGAGLGHAVLWNVEDEDALTWCLLGGPLGAPLMVAVLLVGAAIKGTAYAWRTPQRRAARVEADYRETLRLIEWTPRPVSALDEVRDALAVEQLVAPETQE